MEFDIGNILYIIITLVAISLGLLGRKKKKPGDGVPASGEDDAQPGFLENLERSLNRLGQEAREVMDLDEQEPDLPPEEPEYEPVVESRAEPARSSSLLDNYDQLMKRISQEGADSSPDATEGSEEPIEVIDLEIEEGVDYFQVVKDFNAGTAVVYSAIINRLDY